MRMITTPLSPERKLQSAQIRRDARWGVAQFDALNAAEAAAVAQAKLAALGPVAGMDKKAYEAAKKLARARTTYGRR
jgi:hypothetical protein